MHKIALTVWMGMTVRNLLYGPTIERLSQDYQITIISNYGPLLREALQKFDDKIKYQKLRIPRWQLPGFQGRLVRWLYEWNYFALWLDKKPKTQSIVIQWERKNRPIRYFLTLLGAKIVIRLRRGRDDRDVLRDIAYYFPVRKQFSDTDAILVASTDMEKDQMLIYAFKKTGIPVVCLVHSWDSLPAHGLLSAIPDRLLVWNSFMAEDAVRLHGVPREQIDIVGVPQYEAYRRIAEKTDRGTFKARLKIPENTKVVTYTGGVEWAHPGEPEILENLIAEIARGRFGKAILVFRLHATDERAPFYIEKYTNTNLPIRLDKADSGFAAMNTGKIGALCSVTEFVELMQFSDVVLNMASTVSLDAILFNTPVICPNLELGVSTSAFNWTNMYDTSHFSRVVDSGAISVSKRLSEMLSEIDNALNNPREKERERQLLSSKMMPNLPTSRLIHQSLQIAIDEKRGRDSLRS